MIFIYGIIDYKGQTSDRKYVAEVDAVWLKDLFMIDGEILDNIPKGKVPLENHYFPNSNESKSDTWVINNETLLKFDTLDDAVYEHPELFV